MMIFIEETKEKELKKIIIPDKPGSSKQKYRLAEKARKLTAGLNR